MTEKLKLTQRPTGNGKRLTMLEKLTILAAKSTGMSARATGRKFGVDHTTVILIWNNKELSKNQSELQHIKENMTNRLYLAADRSIDVVHEKVSDLNAYQAALTAGIMIDKARLIDNKSTQNHLVGYLNICNDTPVDLP